MTDTSENSQPSPADAAPGTEAPQPSDQPLSQRVNNRSRQPTNKAFRDFIGSGWGPRPDALPALSEACLLYTSPSPRD